jgi:L-rhamnose-H+ transport protein
VPESTLIGLAAVLAGGVLQGAFMAPMKWTKNWAWENTWLVFASTAYLICPWLLILTTIPQAFDVYRQSSAGSLVTVMLFGLGWGLGAVTFGLGVDAVGLALGFAIILGVAGSAGALVPLWLLPSSISAGKLGLTLISLFVMLAGVAVCSFAGKWKEGKSLPGGVSYGRGVAICVVSGLLSACGNLGFAYGQPIIDRAQAAGVPAYLASNVVWALLTAVLFLCNAGYATLLLIRNRTASRFARNGRYFLFGGLMGVLWMGGFLFYGAGARRLGELGPSLGWAILMSAMVLTANLLGAATGEWKGAPPAASRRLVCGVGLLILAIALLGYANHSVG